MIPTSTRRPEAEALLPGEGKGRLQQARGPLGVLLPLLMLALPACDTVEHVFTQTDAERSDAQAGLEPTVRRVPGVHRALLWKAARTYMERVFPLDITDPGSQVLETHTLEWTENRLPHRTRVTVQVDTDPADPRRARLGVVALLIEPKLEFNNIVTGKPIKYEWYLEGKNPRIEEQVANDIMRRFRLLREGRDPDAAAARGPLGKPRPRQARR